MDVMANPVRNNGINGNHQGQPPIRRPLFGNLVDRVDEAARRQLSFAIPAPGAMSPLGNQFSVDPYARSAEVTSDNEMDTEEELRKAIDGAKRGLQLEEEDPSSSPKRPRFVEQAFSSSSLPDLMSSFPSFGSFGGFAPFISAPAQPESLPWALVKPDNFDAPLPNAQLARARGQKDGRIICPEAPQRINPELKARAENTPFIRNAKETQALMRAKVKENPCIPFDLEIAPGKRVKILRVSTLTNNVGDDASGNGQHAEVYRCEVEGDGEWVLKLFKEEILKEMPHEVLNYAASQLLRYAQSKGNNFLQGHVAEHANLEPHLRAREVREALEETDLIECHTLLRNYIKNIHQGFHFVRLVPGDFPVEFDSTSSIWQQLKAIYTECKKTQICHDLQRDNVRVDERGVVQIIDLFERDPDETNIAMSTRLDTFTDRKDVEAWISQP